MPTLSTRQFQSGLSYNVPMVGGQSPSVGFQATQNYGTANATSFGVGIGYDANSTHLTPTVLTNGVNKLISACVSPQVMTMVKPVCSGLDRAYAPQPYCGADEAGVVINRVVLGSGDKGSSAVLAAQVGFGHEPLLTCLEVNFPAAMRAAFDEAKSEKTPALASSAATQAKMPCMLVVLAALVAAGVVASAQ